MAKKADSKTTTITSEALQGDCEAEVQEIEHNGIESADAAGAAHIIFDLEEPLGRIDKITTALRLLASSRDIDPEAAGALAFLAEGLETDVATVQEQVGQANDKLWAFGQGFVRTERGGEPGASCAAPQPDDFDRMTNLQEHLGRADRLLSAFSRLFWNIMELSKHEFADEETANRAQSQIAELSDILKAARDATAGAFAVSEALFKGRPVAA